jgi:hypothetical protein
MIRYPAQSKKRKKIMINEFQIKYESFLIEESVLDACHEVMRRLNSYLKGSCSHISGLMTHPDPALSDSWIILRVDMPDEFAKYPKMTEEIALLVRGMVIGAFLMKNIQLI